MKKSLFGILCLIITLSLSAQDRQGYKFSKVTVNDFKLSSPVIDENAGAVILADVGSSEFVGNTDGWFTLVFKQRRRILILNRNSFDIATIKIPVYVGKDYTQEEKFEDFDATTYNIENGEVVATKLDKTSVFKEKVTREYGIRKFTFPGIKEGSIIEYQYTVKSPFYRYLRSWYFQGNYPVLWSEYKVTIPPMFEYLTNRQGYLRYTIDTVKSVFQQYSIIDRSSENGITSSAPFAKDKQYNLSGNAVQAFWAIKNVPSFKPESFISTSKNHINKIDFQLSMINYSTEDRKQILKDWKSTAGDLMNDPDFGQQLKDNSWLKDEVSKLAGSGTYAEKAKKIYEYVRDNFKCNDYDEMWLSQSLRKTFQTRVGNVSDINILLTAMYMSNGYDAYPVLISTKDNGYPKETTASLSQYNYVLSRIRMDDNEYFLLDASQSRLGFGKLTKDSYNISGRLIKEDNPSLLNLSADSLIENKITSVFISNNDKNGSEGKYTSNLGYLESFDLRNKLATTKAEDYFKEIKKVYTQGIEVDQLVIDSLSNYDEPISIQYNLKMKFDEDIIYLSPLFTEAWKKNPFVAAEREYPVEMPHQIDQTFILDMEIPKGYKVDEVPKSTRVKLNATEGMFEYISVVSAEKVQLRSRLMIKKATFLSEDYNTLRKFFELVVKKQEEQIVFKKIK